jgi:integrase
MAESGLVSSTARTTGRLPTSTASMEKSPQTTQNINLPHHARNIPFSCVETIEQSYRERGFSREAAARMARPQKPSSIAVYEGKWIIFTSWCGERNTDPLKANAPLVADFLCHLHAVKKLARSTIDGYRTAISHVIKAKTGISLGTDPGLTNLLANFDRDMVKRKSMLPPWNLALVLRMLTKAPFEPLHKAELSHLTLKTVFLLALASGRRRSELHALQCNFQRKEDWEEITIFPDPKFIPKTRLASDGAKAFQPLTLKSLSHEVGRDLPEDRSLCIVRALRFYLDRTDKVRKGRTRLFIAFKQGYDKDIVANTVSGWIKKTVQLTYSLSNQEDQLTAGVRAHDVRGLAASWALLRNVSMDEILAACSWKSHNTFTSFYLKDLTRMQDELLKLGSFTAALHP